jgi:hypothetical protein
MLDARNTREIPRTLTDPIAEPGILVIARTAPAHLQSPGRFEETAEPCPARDCLAPELLLDVVAVLEELLPAFACVLAVAAPVPAAYDDQT